MPEFNQPHREQEEVKDQRKIKVQQIRGGGAVMD
jgi:hypothetical protein